MTVPENYVQVAKRKAADLDGQRALLVLSIDKDMDPVIKKQKEDAVRTLDDQIQKTKSIAGVLDRFQAELASTTTFMDALLSDIMRLQVMGVEQMRQEVPKILQNIQGEITQLEAVEKEIARLA
jgi:hypothetical protein